MEARLLYHTQFIVSVTLVYLHISSQVVFPIFSIFIKDGSLRRRNRILRKRIFDTILSRSVPMLVAT